MKKPKNHGKHWTDQEIEKLKEMANGNRPTGIIAHELQRTEDSIFAKANSENISLKPTNKSPYDRKVSDAKKKKKP
jgi:hypothetical protein